MKDRFLQTVKYKYYKTLQSMSQVRKSSYFHLQHRDKIEIIRCEGTPCGFGDERYDGVCDKDGCDLNPWRWIYMICHIMIGPDISYDVMIMANRSP